MPSVLTSTKEWPRGECRCGRALVYRSSRDIGRKRYCSASCKAEAQRGRRAIAPYTAARKCQNCGIDFIAVVKKQAYCSKSCQGEVGARRAKILADGDMRKHIKRLLVYKDRRHLSIDYVLAMLARQEGRCALSGVPLTAAVGRGRVNTNLSIDRIDSAVGYVDGNIWLVCRVVNIMKNNLSVSEFRAYCSRIAGVRDA